MAKKSSAQMINEMREVAKDLSLKLLEKMTDGTKVEMDEIKHLNEIKKHLKFAESIQKQIDMTKGMTAKQAGKSSVFSPDMVAKIKNLESSIGDIVRQMPTK